MKFKLVLLAPILSIIVASSAMAADRVSDNDMTHAYELLQRGDYIGASRILKPMVARQSTNIVARRYFIYVLLQQGKISQAAAQIRVISALGAHSAFDYWLYADSYFHAGQLATGQMSLTKAFSTLSTPPMFSFLKGYSEKVEKQIRSAQPEKRETNNPKVFPPTPLAAKAEA
ncbi:hypothetical protein BH10CYA1_BH10CYA1_64650 [soil metagenome]